MLSATHKNCKKPKTTTLLIITLIFRRCDDGYNHLFMIFFAVFDLSPLILRRAYKIAVFCATVCKTVRPMLRDRCLTCLSVMSICL